MIKITGSIKRSFIFPATVRESISFYSEFKRIIQFLPHISLVHMYSPNQIRVLFQSIELGAYTIRIFCDLACEADEENRAIKVFPVKIPLAPPVLTETTVRGTTGHGLFSLDSYFYALGEKTRVEYVIRMQGQLDRPSAMKLMPRRVVNKIAQSITENRIREIADGFIQQSMGAFDTPFQPDQTH
jgi:hypothetical protein